MVSVIEKVLLLNQKGYTKDQIVEQMTGTLVKKDNFQKELMKENSKLQDEKYPMMVKKETAKDYLEYTKVNSKLAVDKYSTGKKALRRGDQGEMVKELQMKLNTLAKEYNVTITPVDVDGKFGPATDRAVRQFQFSQGINADGIFGLQSDQFVNKFLLKKEVHKETNKKELKSY